MPNLFSSEKYVVEFIKYLQPFPYIYMLRSILVSSSKQVKNAVLPIS